MIEEILAGIAKRLKEAFPDCRVYEEPVEQGLREPCFLVLLLSAAAAPYPSLRERRTQDFALHFFPARRAGRGEMQKMAEALLDILETIPLANGAALRGTGMRWEIHEGVLHFFVCYNAFVRRRRERIDMADLREEMGLKG